MPVDALFRSFYNEIVKREMQKGATTWLARQNSIQD